MTLSLPDDTVAIEAALRAWIVAASGIPSARVIWGDQNPDRPELVWISMKVMETSGFGRPWVDIEDASPSVAGSEILHIARGVQRGTLSLQCFAGTATGLESCRAILERCRLALDLPTRAAALNDAGIGIGEFSPVQSVGGVRTTYFEPRAFATIRFFLTSKVTEAGTFVETAVLDGEVD